MKRRNLLNFVANASLLGLAAPVVLRAQQQKRITILIPANTGDKSYIDDFSNKNFIPIDIKYYDDFHAATEEIRSGKIKYDGIVTVNQHASQLYSERLLRPINFANVPNFKKSNKSLIGEYTPGEAEYIMGLGRVYHGIGYNKDLFRKPPNSWSFVLDRIQQNSRVAWSNILRTNVIRLASLYLGYGANIQNVQNLRIVRDFLRTFKNNIIFKKNPALLLKDNQADIIVDSSAFANSIIAEIPKLGFSYPIEGTIHEEVCVCIPKNAPNPQLAEKLLNFISIPAIHRQMLENSFLTSNSPDSLKLFSQSYLRNPIIFPNFAEDYNLQKILFINKDMSQNLLNTFEQIFN